MNMNKLTALLFLCFASQISARCYDPYDPYSRFGVCTDKCQDSAPNAGQCAILFKEIKCNGRGFLATDNGEYGIRLFPRAIQENAESIAVRRGCTLEVFKDLGCFGKSFIFTAKNDTELFIKDLGEGEVEDYQDDLDIVDTDDMDDFSKLFFYLFFITYFYFLFFSFTDEAIKCVKCTCGGNVKSGLKKGSSGLEGVEYLR